MVVPKALKSYANFTGKASLAEFWCFFGLYVFIIMQVFMYIGITKMLYLAEETMYAQTIYTESLYGLYLPELHTLTMLSTVHTPAVLALPVVLFIPLVAVTVRRIHDAGLNEWTLLWALIPCIGLPILLLLVLSPSEDYDLDTEG